MTRSANARRMVGIVCRLLPDKGYFFIRGSDDREYFAFGASLPNRQSMLTLREHDTQIRFTPEETQKGPRATDMEILEPGNV